MRTFRFLILLSCLPWTVWAQTATPVLPKKISAPIFLKPADKIPMNGLDVPAVPDQGPDGTAWEVKEAIDAPPVNVLAQLSQPDLFEAIKADKKKETGINQIVWHTSGDSSYCHFRDQEGSNWYGWSDNQAFHWVLMLGNRYWWHDDFAGHWLYFAKGYWWQADAQTANQIQVLVKGEYYLCQKDGTLLKDMGQDGNGEILSANGRYQGDSHHGGHGGHGEGHGGHGEGHSSNGSNGAANTGSSGSSGSAAAQ